MKMVIAVIQPTKLQAVYDALAQINVHRMTVCDGQTFIDDDHPAMLYRGVGYETQVLRKVVLEVVVNDDFLDKTVDTILQMARTQYQGNIEDGKIFIMPVDQVIQLHPPTKGPSAV